jgi:hypothetical protein
MLLVARYAMASGQNLMLADLFQSDEAGNITTAFRV